MSDQSKAFTTEDRWELIRRISADMPAAAELQRRAETGEVTDEDCQAFADQVVASIEDATRWMIKKRGRVDYEALRKWYEETMTPEDYAIWHREIYSNMLRLQEEALSYLDEDPPQRP